MKIYQNCIDEFLISKDEKTNVLGLQFGPDKKCAVMMEFFDGQAIEVDMDGNAIPKEKDPIVLTYPTMMEVRQSKKLQEEIINATSCQTANDIIQYHVALTYGMPARMSGCLYVPKEVMPTIPHINFRQKMKDLHRDMCNEIASLMRQSNTKELDLLGTDASHTSICMESRWGETREIEVEKVLMNEDGEVTITSTDWEHSDEDVNILSNRYVVPCSVRDLYETVYEELVVKKM